MYSALNNAFTSILKFLSTVSSSHKSLVAREETVNGVDFERRNRVLIATVRVLCSWLAEETSASRDEGRQIPHSYHLITICSFFVCSVLMGNITPEDT